MTIPIVCIGASAGGLKEIERFFKNMPNSKKAAFVIIQHLAPDHKSILADIVNRYTEMDAVQIENGMEIAAGKVYIIPPDKAVYLSENKLLLSKMQRHQGRQLPIDAFLRSIKATLKEKAIAVILSGTGSDGSLGLKEVKEAGGLTIVQDPETADYDGMPRSALKTGLIDFCVSVGKMANVISDYIDNNFVGKNIQENEWENYDTLDKIFSLIKSQLKHDFSNYKKTTVKRRIERRMIVNKTKSLEDYLALLGSNNQELGKLYKELLISVTSFFRDKKTFDYIAEEIIPKVVNLAAENKNIRIWVPACATGEEAYTWGMLFKNYLKRHSLDYELKIFASDIDPDAIGVAREGFYDRNIIADVPQDWLSTYFFEENDGYRIKQSFRKQVVFAEQNLLSDPPYSKIDLISCRNVLIYLDNEAQIKATTIFHYALNKEGILLLGNTETLGKNNKYYKTISKKHKLYEKLNSIDMPRRVWSIIDKSETKDYPVSERKQKGAKALNEIANDFLLEKFAPSSVIVDKDKDILYIQGRMGKFLEMTTGIMSNNLLTVAKKGLRSALANSIRKSISTNKEIKTTGIRIKDGKDSSEFVDMLVSPLSTDEGLYMVSFSIKEAQDINRSNLTENSKEESMIDELEKELANKEQYLQNIIEELETTNEELKSANEEAQSANEELQSTNEELETSKEELQSVNEELFSTNTELNHKVKELTNVTDTLNNLLASTEIATIFLDNELRIFWFTPPINSIINLIKLDIGRPFNQFTHNLEYEALNKDANEVLRTLMPKSTEVKTKDERFFWMRINPFRTINNTIEGVVITFTDITDKKKNEEELLKYKLHLEVLVEEKSAELVESEKKFKEISAISSDFAFSFKVENNELMNEWTFGSIEGINGTQKWTKLNIDALPDFIFLDDQPLAKKSFKSILQGKTIKEDIRIVTNENEIKWIRCKVMPVWHKSEKKIIRVIGTAYDITAQKENQLNLAKSEMLLKRSESVADLGSWEWDIKTDKVTWSDQLFRMFQISPEEGTPTFSQLVDEKNAFFTLESIVKSKKAVETTLEKGINYELEIDAIKRNGELFHCVARGYIEKNKQGDIVKLYGSLQDISARKKIEKTLKLSERKYKNIAENIPGLVLKYSLKPDGTDKLLYVSKGVEDLYEIPLENAKKNIGLMWNMIHEDDLEPYRKSLEQSQKSLSLWNKEFRIKLPDGRVKWLHGRGVPSLKKDGSIVWDSIAMDITYKKETERLLKESEKNFRAMFDNSITANIVADDDGNYLMVNKAATLLFGRSKEEMLQMNVREIKAINFKDSIHKQYKDFVKKGVEIGEIEFTSKNGERKVAFYHAIKIKKDFNLSVLIDITKQNETLVNLEESKVKLTQLNETKDKLLAIIGHDIKNPIGHIVVFSEMLLDEEENHTQEEIKEFNFINYNAARRLSILVDNLLTWAIAQMNRTEFDIKTFALKEASEETIEAIEIVADKKEITIINSIHESTTVFADKSLVKTIFRNLLSNAIKFSNKGGKIELKAQKREKDVLISVIDNGVGIPQDKLGKLFNYEVNKSERGTDGEQGTGLGLSICKDFVEMNNGEIWAESDGENGSTFHFTLPIELK